MLIHCTSYIKSKMLIAAVYCTMNNADIAQETIRIFANADDGQKAKVARDTTFYTGGTVPHITRNYATVISVERGDTLAVTRKYLDERPCVLNMASKYQPGGGWLRGATAQEEQLSYRSGLYQSLSHFSHQYPLAAYDALYSKDVRVIRDDNMKLLAPDEQYDVSFVSMAAICRPLLIENRLCPPDVKRTAEKMRIILRVAYINGHSTLILGAFGCGAYGNPPEQIAALFRDVLAEPEFRDVFKRVVFAILDSFQSDNYNVFYRTFSRN